MPKWSKAELDLLEKLWGEGYSALYIAERINRTPDAIKLKALRMNFYRPPIIKPYKRRSKPQKVLCKDCKYVWTDLHANLWCGRTSDSGVSDSALYQVNPNGYCPYAKWRYK